MENSEEHHEVVEGEAEVSCVRDIFQGVYLVDCLSSGRLRLTLLQVASAVIEAALAIAVGLAIEADEVEGAVVVEVHREEVEALQGEEAARNLVSEEEPKS